MSPYMTPMHWNAKRSVRIQSCFALCMVYVNTLLSVKPKYLLIYLIELLCFLDNNERIYIFLAQEVQKMVLLDVLLEFQRTLSLN